MHLLTFFRILATILSHLITGFTPLSEMEGAWIALQMSLPNTFFTQIEYLRVMIRELLPVGESVNCL